MPKFDLVLLDADGTLFDYDWAEKMALAGVFQAHCWPFDDATLAHYRQFNTAVWAEFEQGRLTKDELQSARFDRLVAQLGLDGDGGQLNSEYLDHLATGAVLLPGAEQVCRELARHCRLVLATNGIARVQRQRVALSAIRDYVTDVIVSEEAGYQKPQPGFFRYAFQRCNHLDKQRAIMVGDSLSADIAGGAAFGITTCWFNPLGKPADARHPADHQISQLPELLPIVLGA